MDFALEIGLDNIVPEGDNESLYKALKSGDRSLAQHEHLTKDILFLFKIQTPKKRVIDRIGSSIEGAVLLLPSSPPAARHVIDAAFDRQGHGKQPSALHALGNIAGESRPENKILLNGDAEESLQRLMYITASKSSELTPSGLSVSVLQPDSEIRLAVRIVWR
nr:hypothetical protein CFP56_78917 [Quercus suber]